MNNKFGDTQHTSECSDKYLVWKRVIAFFSLATVILIVLSDAYNIKNGWMHPETAVWSVVYLSDYLDAKIGLSFNPEEFKKIFWWEQYVDFGLTRLLTAFFSVADIKLRAWLFQFIPPNPAVSLSWLFTLFLTPLLLFRFLRKYIKLGVIGAAVITVVYLASPATGSLTFLNYHPGRALTNFLLIVILNICMELNYENSIEGCDNKKQTGMLILLGIILFLSLYADAMIFIVFLLIPLFFPKLFGNPLAGIILKLTGKEAMRTESCGGPLACFFRKVMQVDYKNFILPLFLQIMASYISFAILYYCYKKWIRYIIEPSLPLDIKTSIKVTFPWMLLILFMSYFFIFFMRRCIDITKKYISVDLHYYKRLFFYQHIYLVYVIVGAGYSLSVFWLIPKLSNWAGYSYNFLQAQTLDVGSGTYTYLSIFGFKYYMAVVANTYWFLIGGLGIRKYLPLYMDGNIMNYHSIGIFLLVHIILIGFCFITYIFASKNKHIIISLVALYLTTAWITLLHAHMGFYLQWSNYLYGSIFSIILAILLGAILSSYTKQKKLYTIIIIILLISSYLTYSHLKEINQNWKGGHYPNIDLDGFYSEYKDYWKDIKNKKIDFDMNVCKIDWKLRYGIENRDALPSYSYGDVQHAVAFNKEYMRAVNFAAFCGDNHIMTSEGLLGYIIPANLGKIKLTPEQLIISSSYETRQQAIDGDIKTIWHVKFPKEEIDSFLEIDIGVKKSVEVLRILPRVRSIANLWIGRNAVWEGSDDGQNWQALAALKIDKSFLQDSEWISFVLPKERTFSHYRLRIRYQPFLSLAEIELYG